MLISTFIGWAILLLFLLPFCTVTIKGQNFSYSLFHLMLGSVIEGRANYWLGAFFSLLVLAPAIPLFSRRQSISSLVVFFLVELFGIVGILVGNRSTIIGKSFHVPATLTGDIQLGFVIPLVLLFVYLGVPFAARAISTSIAVKRFDQAVKTGKKLANY